MLNHTIKQEIIERRHLIEVVTLRRSGLFNFMQAHAWLRFVNPDGKVTSVGFFGECPISNLWQVLRHLVPRRGKILSPDLYEASTTSSDQLVTAIAIDKEHFEQALAFIKGLQLARDCSFQLLDILTGNNCAGFVGAVLRHIGLEITAEQFNLPADLAAWQTSVHNWRESQVTALKKNNVSIDETSLNAIRYGLPSYR